MLGLQSSRFDRLLLWSPQTNQYIDVGDYIFEELPSLQDQIAADDARILALEAKLTTLDEQKAAKFVAVDPLSLDEGVFPNRLSQSEGPAPASATAISLNGVDTYIELQGRTHVLDFTKDWSVGVSVITQGASVQGANLVCFASGGVSLNLKVQGAPSETSNWGSYNSSNGDLYHVTGRFNANTWAGPTDDSRLLWVYTAATKQLAYYISYEDGSFSRKANIAVPQSAIDAQTPSAALCFGKPWTGTGGAAFSGTAYQGVLADWMLSPHAWTELEITQYFSVGPEELPSLDLWDKVSSFIVPGEYPAVVDAKGNLTDGALINGVPSDFV